MGSRVLRPFRSEAGEGQGWRSGDGGLVCGCVVVDLDMPRASVLRGRGVDILLQIL